MEQLPLHYKVILRIIIMYIPDNIKNIIGGKPFSADTVGMSDSQVICFSDMVLKIEKSCEESDNERRMMSWLSDRLPVPKILAFEKENGMNYLLMTKLGGEMSCSSSFLENPEVLAGLLADSLKMLWSVDISDCPYNNMLDNKLRLAEYRVSNNLCDTNDVEPGPTAKTAFHLRLICLRG